MTFENRAALSLVTLGVAIGSWLLILMAVVATVHCATITTSATASTSPWYTPQPDCKQSSALNAQCNTNGAGAGASASGWFDESSGQGGVRITTNADHSSGYENATASASAVADIWFMPTWTGEVIGMYTFALGPSWGWPPALSIMQGSASASPHGTGEVSLTSQVFDGVPFEVVISLADTVSAPSGAGYGEAEVFRFFHPMMGDAVTPPRETGKYVVLEDPPAPSSVPEPGAGWLCVGPLGYMLGLWIRKGLKS